MTSPVGMIDWLTIAIDASIFDRQVMAEILKNRDRVLRIDGVTGETKWETVAREEVRSDDHHVNVSFGSRLTISGSPARVSHLHNVFGSLDIKQCALDMINFVSVHHKMIIPRNLKLWSCSRIDVTTNYDMGSLAIAQQAIDFLKPLKCGQQKTATFDTSCCWGYGSCLHSGKAYLKGPHIRKLISRKTAFLSDSELQKADRLLRLEYSIRRLLIRRIRESSALNWYDFTPEFLLEMHQQYFSKFISTVEVTDMCDIKEKLLKNVGPECGQIPTQGQALSAYACYNAIRLHGMARAKEDFTKRSWHRHIKNLKSIGIVAADLQPMNVVPLKRRPIYLDQPVSSWDDIKLQA